RAKPDAFVRCRHPGRLRALALATLKGDESKTAVARERRVAAEPSVGVLDSIERVGFAVDGHGRIIAKDPIQSAPFGRNAACITNHASELGRSHPLAVTAAGGRRNAFVD